MVNFVLQVRQRQRSNYISLRYFTGICQVVWVRSCTTVFMVILPGCITLTALLGTRIQLKGLSSGVWLPVLIVIVQTQ